MSRWYPETLVTRLTAIRSMRARISFFHEDAFIVIDDYANDSGAMFFVDPPYTAGGKKAGKRLYRFGEIDHERLFALVGNVRGSVMMTYDDVPEVRSLATRHGFRTVFVPMKTAHHSIIHELVLLRP